MTRQSVTFSRSRRWSVRRSFGCAGTTVASDRNSACRVTRSRSRVSSAASSAGRFPPASIAAVSCSIFRSSVPTCRSISRRRVSAFGRPGACRAPAGSPAPRRSAVVGRRGPDRAPPLRRLRDVPIGAIRSLRGPRRGYLSREPPPPGVRSRLAGVRACRDGRDVRLRVIGAVGGFIGHDWQAGLTNRVRSNEDIIGLLMAEKEPAACLARASSLG